MTAVQIYLLLVLLVALLLFVRARLRHDVVAFGALMTAVLIGVVPAEEALAGFGHPAVFTVACVLMISRTLRNSGVMHAFAERLARAEGHPRFQSGVLMSVIAALSGFMNNVGALSIGMPIAMDTCAKNQRPPSQLLMPLAFASILGGLVTLIGTPPNLVISAYRGQITGEAFSMFDFAPIGLPVALVGLAFLLLFSHRLVPTERKAKSNVRERFEVGAYVTELRVPLGSPLEGKEIADVLDPVERDLELIALVRANVPMFDALNHTPLAPEDVLVVRADSHTFGRLAQEGVLELVGNKDLPREHLQPAEVGILELGVPLGSRLEARTPCELRLHSRMGVNILAIARRGEPIMERLDDISIQAGDVLLLQGDIEKMDEVVQIYGALPLAERGLTAISQAKRWQPAILFLIAVLLTTLGVLQIHIAFGLALVAMVVIRAVSVRQLYDFVDWSVIVLLGAMIPIGHALETTGTTKLLADTLLLYGSDLHPLALVAAIMLATTALTNVLNNAATAVIMAPIAMGLATQLDTDPDPFLMAVVVGASCAFLTPIAHQNNVLVLGPGGYRFGDYARLGAPLTLITLIIGVAAIGLWWY